MTYEWLDKEVTRTSTWSNAVRNAMRKGSAEWHRKKILRKTAGKWSKEFCKVAETQNAQGLKVIRYAANTGPQGIIKVRVQLAIKGIQGHKGRPVTRH